MDYITREQCCDSQHSRENPVDLYRHLFTNLNHINTIIHLNPGESFIAQKLLFHNSEALRCVCIYIDVFGRCFIQNHLYYINM